jgi:SAM-dependent methyltransferase
MTALECWYGRRVKEHPQGALLEFGCGRGFPLTRLLGARFAQRCATDIDDIARHDIPSNVVFERCTADNVPFGDEQFDVVVIRSVLEHVEEPAKTFTELARVTKPGGRVLMNLPNKWDYVSVIARLTGPFKSSILKNIVRTQWEDFPVRYRCNTRRALHRFARAAGFDVVEFMPLPSQPSYLAFFVPLYMLGAIYQFFVSICGIDALQPSFVVLLRKHADAGTGEPQS